MEGTNAQSGGSHTERRHDEVEHIRALVVDDNEINARILQNILESRNVPSDYADCGGQALRMASAAVYDIIFMDYIMPDMDGIETTRRLRMLSGYEAKPVIGLTADVGEELKSVFLRVGVGTILTKPVNPCDIDVVLGRRTEAAASGEADQGQNKDGSRDGDTGLRKYLKSIEELDYTLGLRNSVGNEKNYYLVMKMAVKNINECERNVNNFLQDHSDYAALRIALHSLKGIFINIGLEKPSRGAAALERRVRGTAEGFAGDCLDTELLSELELLDRRLLKITHEISQALDAYDNMRKNRRDGETAVGASEVTESMAELLCRAGDALQRFDIDSLTGYLEKLAIIAESDEKKLFEEALDAAREFNYDYVNDVFLKIGRGEAR